MIRLLLCLPLLALAVAPAPAQYAHSASLQTRYDYWPGGHWKGRWYAAGYYPVKVLVEQQHCPPAAKIVVNPDVYYSTADHYRDQALVDAVTAKVQEALKQSAPAQVGERELILKLTEQLLRQSVQAPAPAQLPPPDPPAPPASDSRRPAARDVHAGRHQDQALAKVVNDHCSRCHGPNKADAGLALMTAEGALADVPEGLLWKSFALVTSGEMPKQGNPLGDKAVELFYAWAKAGGRRTQALEYFPLGLASAMQHTPPKIVLEVQQDHHGHGQALRLRSYQQAPVLEIREVRPPRRFLRFKQPPVLEIREVRPIKRQRLLLIEQRRY